MFLILVQANRNKGRRAISAGVIIPMLTHIVIRNASKLKIDPDEGQAAEHAREE